VCACVRACVCVCVCVRCRLNKAQLRNGVLEDKWRAVGQAVLSVEERAAQFDQLLREEEQAAKVSLALALPLASAHILIDTHTHIIS